MSHLALVVESDRPGPNLTPCSDWQNPKPFDASFKVPQGASFFRNRCVELSEVAARATAIMGIPVIDRTSLTGLWNYALTYVRPQPATVTGAVAVDAPFFDTAIRQQLGLKLQPERGPVEVLVIEHVAPPVEN
jgi:uncharacterized protein (TIGR03435 family)